MAEMEEMDTIDDMDEREEMGDMGRWLRGWMMETLTVPRTYLVHTH